MMNTSARANTEIVYVKKTASKRTNKKNKITQPKKNIIPVSINKKNKQNTPRLTFWYLPKKPNLI